jgi:hypothetical protein
VKKLVLAAALASALAGCAAAPSSSSHADRGEPPRDPPFGKGLASNDTLNEPSAAGAGYTSNQVIPPRDPPFGRGDASYSSSGGTTGQSFGSSNQTIPPRDPPFGKGN